MYFVRIHSFLDNNILAWCEHNFHLEMMYSFNLKWLSDS